MELTIDEAIKYFYAGVELEVLFEGADFWINNKYIPTRFTKDKYRLKKWKESLLEVDYMTSVMQAYKEGKIIEFKPINESKWLELIPHCSPSWAWSFYNYRIKQTKKMESIDYQISVMQAFKSGNTIESTPKEYTYWTVNDSPKWNWADVNYRVKQKPKLTPYSFDDAEALIGKAIKLKKNSEIMLITFVSKNSVSLASYGTLSFRKVLSECTWLDGSPCGKMI